MPDGFALGDSDSRGPLSSVRMPEEDHFNMKIAFNRSMPTNTAIRANPNIWDEARSVMLGRSMNASIFMACHECQRS